MGWTFTLAFIATVGMFTSFKEFTPLIFPCIFAVGFFAHVPFVLLWGYIPELYETRIRSTAFGVTYNVGRFVAAAATLLQRRADQGAGWFVRIWLLPGGGIFLLGTVVSFFMPKPCGKMIDS